MVIKLLRLLFGYVTFSFSNGFSDDFINDCFLSGVMLQNIQKNDDCLLADCTPKEYKRLHRIARLHGGIVKIEARHGILLKLARFSNRIGLGIGVLTCLVLFSILSGFVWNIEIVGNESLSNEEISDFLEQNGFATGVFWRSVDKSVIEDLLMASYGEIAWAHINRFGTTARVEISESTEKPKVVEKDGVANLKARCDGVIVSVEVYDGWQTVMVGEAVHEGDILISGVYESEQAKKNLFAHARGNVVARVEERIDLNIPRTEKRRSYTSEKEYFAVSFFGLYLPLYFGRIPDENADVSKTVKYLEINSNPIPVGFIRHNAKKYSLEEYSMNDTQLNEKAQSVFKDYLNSEFGEDNVILQEVVINLESDSARVVGNVSVLENIGVESSINIVSDEQN